MSDSKINIVPLLAEEVSKDGSQIKNVFDRISYKRGTEGRFSICFFINAILDTSYLIKFVIIRKGTNGIEALFIDSFRIPPSDDFMKKHGGVTKKFESDWSFSGGNIISGQTNVHLNYSTINLSGEYGILAFAQKVEESEDVDDETSLGDMKLICEKHFFVDIEE